MCVGLNGSSSIGIVVETDNVVIQIYLRTGKNVKIVAAVCQTNIRTARRKNSILLYSQGAFAALEIEKSDSGTPMPHGGHLCTALQNSVAVESDAINCAIP